MDEITEIKLYKIASTIFGILAVIIIINVFISHPEEYAVGESFVLTHFTYPTPIYTFHFKPITLVMMLGFLWWMIGLNGWKKEFARIPSFIKNVLKIFLFLCILVFMYEFLQVFLLWTSFYIKFGGNYDLLYNQINPGMPKPVNFLFVSKLYALFLGGAVYTLYFLEKRFPKTS
jgi:hypothetical protein